MDFHLYRQPDSTINRQFWRSRDSFSRVRQLREESERQLSWGRLEISERLERLADEIEENAP